MLNYNILFMAQPIYAEVENITPPEHVYFVLEEFSSMDSDPPVYAEIEDFGNRPLPQQTSSTSTGFSGVH